jgi:polyphosphate kinase
MKMFAAQILSLSLFAAPLGAHPHIFVNTGLVFVVDAENRLTHVQVTWEYDELYSLLVTEDMGVDEDYDGVLNASDLATLTGFDMNWVEGYNGDLVGALDGVPLELSPPLAPTANMIDGKITTTHMRSVQGAPKISSPFSFRPYDGSFYTAYDVKLPVRVEGRIGCDVALDVPNAQELAMTKAEVSMLPEDFDMDAAGLGDIGARFATEVIVTCAAL